MAKLDAAKAKLDEISRMKSKLVMENSKVTYSDTYQFSKFRSILIFRFVKYIYWMYNFNKPN